MMGGPATSSVTTSHSTNVQEKKKGTDSWTVLIKRLLNVRHAKHRVCGVGVRRGASGQGGWWKGYGVHGGGARKERIEGKAGCRSKQENETKNVGGPSDAIGGEKTGIVNLNKKRVRTTGIKLPHFILKRRIGGWERGLIQHIETMSGYCTQGRLGEREKKKGVKPYASCSLNGGTQHLFFVRMKPGRAAGT